MRTSLLGGQTSLKSGQTSLSPIGTGGGSSVVEVLADLRLSTYDFTVGTASGSVIGAIVSKKSGSTLAIVASDGRFAIDGSNNLVVGPVPSVTGDYQVTLRETLAGASNSPRDTTLTITVRP